MIKEIALENVRSHKKSKAVFHKGVNVFVGKSDHGKSTFIKAIDLVCNNRPLGNDFVRDGSDTLICRIIFETSNGKEFSVTRKKGKINEYILDVDGKSETFTAFGTDVPTKIKELINFCDLNIQPQFDPYFLVFDTPGKVAAYIREIAGLDILDKSVKVASSRLLETEKKLKAVEESLTQINNKLKKEEEINLDLFRSLLHDVERVINDIDDNESIIKRLGSIVEDFNGIKTILIPNNIDEVFDELEKIKAAYISKINTYEHLCGLVRQVESIKKINVGSDIDAAVDDVNNLICKYSDCVKVAQALDNLIKNINAVARINISDNIPDYAPLISDYRSKIKIKERLIGLLENILDVDERIETISDRLDVAYDEYKKNLALLNNCPYCNSKLTSDGKRLLLERT
jgi:DNA repair exonuclease SbcCD ATPase subunit